MGWETTKPNFYQKSFKNNLSEVCGKVGVMAWIGVTVRGALPVANSVIGPSRFGPKLVWDLHIGWTSAADWLEVAFGVVADGVLVRCADQMVVAEAMEEHMHHSAAQMAGGDDLAGFVVTLCLKF